LACRENASELIDFLLVQQAFLAEAGTARGDLHSVKNNNEAGREDNGK